MRRAGRARHRRQPGHRRRHRGPARRGRRRGRDHRPDARLAPDPLAGTLLETAAAIEATGAPGRSRSPPTSPTPTTAPASSPRSTPALGPVDILVNNAAAAFYLPTAEMTSEAPARCCSSSTCTRPSTSSSRWCRACANEARAGSSTSRARPRSVPQGPPFDVGGKLGATSTMYGATKSALERITAGLAAELFDDGIALNTIAPVAAVRTPGAEAHLG